MKSKSKKKLLYIVVLIISVVLISIMFVFLSFDEYSDGIVDLAIVKPSTFSCKSWSYFIDTDITGAKRQYGAKTVDFFSFNKLEVLSASGKTMKSIDTQTKTECNPIGSTTTDIYLVGGTVKISFFGKGENGQFVFLKQVDRTLSTTPVLVLSKSKPVPYLLPSGLITATEINSKIPSSRELFSTTITITVDVKLKFSQAGKLYETVSGNGIMTAGVPVKIYNPVKTPIPSTSNVVDLKQLSQSVFDLKVYKTSSLALWAKGELPQWNDSQGFPYVKVIDPNGKSVGTFLMSSKKLINSATNTYEFTTTNLVLPKSPQGVWKIEMHSNGDSRKISSTIPSTDVMIVKIYDSTPPTTPYVPPPVPTVTCMKLTSGQDICLGDDEFKSGGVCYGKDLQQCVTILNQSIPPPHNLPKTELGTASGFIAYRLTFDQGGIDVGQVPTDSSIQVDFVPLGLIASPKGIDEKFQTMTLIQSIDTTQLGASQITNMNANTKFNVLIDGNQITQDIALPSTQLKKLGVYSTARDYFMMNQLTLSSVDINRILADNNYRSTCEVVFDVLDNCNQLQDGQVITIQSVTDGTFDVTNTSGSYKGAFAGLTFTYDLRYASEDSFNPDPCKGLSGEEKLICNGGDPNNCVDFIDVIGDENCNTKEGQTGGYCQGLTSTECANKGKNDFSPNDELCKLLGLCSNPDGKGSDTIICPNGSFVTKDPQGNHYCADNTTRESVNPLNSITSLVPDFDIQMIVIIGIVVLLLFLILVVLKRRKK